MEYRTWILICKSVSCIIGVYDYFVWLSFDCRFEALYLVSSDHTQNCVLKPDKLPLQSMKIPTDSVGIFICQLLSMVYKMILTVKTVIKTLVCELSIFSCGRTYYATQGGFNFWVCEWAVTLTRFIDFYLVNF